MDIGRDMHSRADDADQFIENPEQDLVWIGYPQSRFICVREEMYASASFCDPSGTEQGVMEKCQN